MFRNKGNKKYKKKGARKNEKHTKDTKGFWEYSHFQKEFKKSDEELIKRKLSDRGGFDPHKTQDYINPPKTKEQIIEEKILNGEKINSKESIVYNNYKDKKIAAINKDLNLLEKYGVNAEVQTSDGRKRKLLLTLNLLLKKGDEVKITHIYLKLKDEQFSLTPQLEREFSDSLQKMNDIVKKVDIIKLQMTQLHSCQPPLDQKGFVKLDDFQIEVINNLDNNISTIVSAPTSAGKSVISNYHIKNKLKLLVVLPTDVLAWQHAAYYTKYLNFNVPIITKSHQSSPRREELLKLVNSSDVLVGTADDILDFLPMIKVSYDWVIFDEIHMIGEIEGSSMEHIARLFSSKKFLALSATIGNIDYLKGWFESIGYNPVSVVKCEKRFFNLQRYSYDTTNNKLNSIHPIGMVDDKDFESGKVLEKSLQPTPPDIWDFAVKLSNVTSLGKLDPYNYFDSNIRITLDMSNKYFNDILKKAVQLYKNKKNTDKINKIIAGYRQTNLHNEDIDLLKVILHLKEVKKCPAIIFQENSTSCMRLVRQFAKQVENAESEKYPKLYEDRLKEIKKAKKLEKQYDKKKIDEIPDNKLHKIQMDDVKSSEIEAPVVNISLQEPHKDFIFNDDMIITQSVVENWMIGLRKYFPSNQDGYHWLIIMLWRGVGVYVKGLPDPYLRLVQELASSKKLAVVFSDNSLVFGVSMPFRTTVILRDFMTRDTLNSMMYSQMAGRAGRRGLDKEGNVVFCGYSFERIKDLSISSLPSIVGRDTMIYPVEIGKKIAINSNNACNWDRIKINFLHPDLNNEVSSEFYSDIHNNMTSEGGWDFVINGDNNHDIMVWKLRKDIDCITIPMLIPEFKKCFDTLNPTVKKFQVEAALFLSHFIHIKECDNKESYVLPGSSYLDKGLASNLKSYATNLGIDIPENIDSKVYTCIDRNKLLDLGNEHDNDLLRDRLFEFSEKVRHIQHYFFHSNFISVTRLLGKLLTRIWWIYHMSSPLMKKMHSYEEDITPEEDSDEDSDEEYETDSDSEEA